MCNIFTEAVGINWGNDTTVSAPRTTCTSTKRRVTQGCEVTAATTTLFDSCTRKQTATDFTKFCTESVSSGVTYTPCTKTVSTVIEGCSVTATTTSVIDDVCQAQVKLAPDDPQGEFGTLPATSSNETCPYFPGLNVTVLDDQGSDGQKKNDTCPMPNGTRTSLDDDQGDDEPKQTCKLNNGTMVEGGAAPSCPSSNTTLIQGPDGAEDGNATIASCPLNNTITFEPDGALDGDSAPLCNATFNMNATMEQELGQGEDGTLNQSCPIGGDSTLEVDNEQGEDRQPTQEDLCPVIPDGIILSPLADQGDYAPINESSCPALDSRYPISWLDEQGDDWHPVISACPIPNITIEELPDEPTDSANSTSSASSSSTTDCRPPSVEGLGRCALVLPKMKAKRDVPIIEGLQAAEKESMLAERGVTSGSPVTSWSCSCQWQTAGQVVTATTKCGTPMCPNWQTTSTRTSTEIDTKPMITFQTPIYTPCKCLMPTSRWIGACSSWTAANAPHNPKPEHLSCECELNASHAVSQTILSRQDVCGQLVCPNQLELTSLEVPEKCPKSACIPPINTNIGVCWQKSYAFKRKGEDFTGWECICNDDSGRLIPPVSGCNNSPVCPNQADLITNIPNGLGRLSNTDWPCPTTLPNIPFFNSCVRIGKDKSRQSCNCGISGDPGNTQVFAAFGLATFGMSGCSDLLCPNSRYDAVGRRAPQVIEPGQYEAGEFTPRAWATSTATVVGPLSAAITDATPGPVPTAAGPTVLMA